jgi:phosphomevalonate kinase
MTKCSSWRGLNELVDAKERAKEMLRALEALHKEQRTLDGKEIKRHADKLASEVDETLALLQEKFRQIVEDLEGHKQRIAAMRDFLERHYKLK